MFFFSESQDFCLSWLRLDWSGRRKYLRTWMLITLWSSVLLKDPHPSLPYWLEAVWLSHTSLGAFRIFFSSYDSFSLLPRQSPPRAVPDSLKSRSVGLITLIWYIIQLSTEGWFCQVLEFTDVVKWTIIEDLSLAEKMKPYTIKCLYLQLIM